MSSFNFSHRAFLQKVKKTYFYFERQYYRSQLETALEKKHFNAFWQTLQLLDKKFNYEQGHFSSPDNQARFTQIFNSCDYRSRTLLAHPNYPTTLITHALERGATAQHMGLSWDNPIFKTPDVVRELLAKGAHVDLSNLEREPWGNTRCLLPFVGLSASVEKSYLFPPKSTIEPNAALPLLYILEHMWANGHSIDQVYGAHTLLMTAVGTSCESFARTLLGKGANPALELSVAPKIAYPIGVSPLEKIRANAQNSTSAFELACSLSNLKMAQLLIDYTLEVKDLKRYQAIARECHIPMSTLTDILKLLEVPLERAKLQGEIDAKKPTLFRKPLKI